MSAHTLCKEAAGRMGQLVWWTAYASAVSNVFEKFSGAKDEASAVKIIKTLAVWSASQLDKAVPDGFAAPADVLGPAVGLLAQHLMPPIHWLVCLQFRDAGAAV